MGGPEVPCASRFQTSVQPSPPPCLAAPFSKVYQVPSESASAGIGCPSIRHRSMKCSWEPGRSLSPEADHFRMNS